MAIKKVKEIINKNIWKIWWRVSNDLKLYYWKILDEKEEVFIIAELKLNKIIEIKKNKFKIEINLDEDEEN